MLHGLENLGRRQEEAGAAKLLLPFGLELLRGDVPLSGEDVVPGGEVENAGGLDCFAKMGGAGLLEGEEVEEHLNVQAHADRREVKGLFAGLVVHHPEKELSVFQPAVHPVHLAADPELAVGL